jgi:peptide/nickel transport system ATP-binding protein
VRVVREVPIKGEIPSAADIPPGCRFHPRCLFARPECADLPEPELTDIGGGHQSACRRHGEI